MHIDLKGKTAVVTASTAGIARDRRSRAPRARRRQRPQRCVGAVRAQAPARRPPDADFDGVAADLSDAAGVARVTQHTSAADILVNNAGIYGLKAFFDIDDAEWEHYFQMNVMSGVRLARHYLKGMIERNAGRIVFISSESGLNIPVDMIHYGFTKTAQLSIARGLAKLAAGERDGQLGAAGADDVGRRAGAAEGNGRRNRPQRRGRGRGFRAQPPLGSIIQRPATPEEVAKVVYVCSPLASATTAPRCGWTAAWSTRSPDGRRARPPR